MRNLLFILAENDKVAWPVAHTVADNFDQLPEDVRNLLFILAEKDETAKIVKEIIRDNFFQLPEKIIKLGESI